MDYMKQVISPQAGSLCHQYEAGDQDTGWKPVPPEFTVSPFNGRRGMDYMKPMISSQAGSLCHQYGNACIEYQGKASSNLK